MSTLIRTAAAALLALGFAGPAFANAPQIVGQGENASVVYSGPAINIAGSALTRLVGSGESATVELVAVQVAQNPRHVISTSRGENSERVVVREFAPAGMLAALFGTNRG
jgi:hypothetical protein